MITLNCKEHILEKLGRPYFRENGRTQEKISEDQDQENIYTQDT